MQNLHLGNKLLPQQSWGLWGRACQMRKIPHRPGMDNTPPKGGVSGFGVRANRALFEARPYRGL